MSQNHRPTPSINFRPPTLGGSSFTSGDAGHSSGGGGSSRAGRSAAGSGTSGQVPFLQVFQQHQSSLEADYLWMLEGRVRLEEQYADQLLLLTQRTRALDSGTDALGKDNQRDALPTVRRAWRQILENSEQEVESRRAFANAIKEEVLAPLTNLKNTQQRIASRIADDVKNSRARYAEQAAVLQKLQKIYFQKTQAYVELSKDSAQPFAGPPTHPHTPLNGPSGSMGQLYGPQAAATVDQTREKITDLAATGKKGFNQLFANLRSGGDQERDSTSNGGQSTAGSGGAGLGRKSVDEARERADAAHRAERKREQNEAGALKSAKAKREAEDADAKYRLGVFHLESLRINLEKVLQGGSNSAAEFVQELIIHLQSAFSKYSIAHQATEMFCYQVARRSEEAVNRVSLATDLAGGLSTLGGARDLPAPTLYTNYFVGECRDLIFGVSLMDYAYARGIGASDTDRVPTLVAKCIAGVESRGLNAEGLYRISPRQSAVQSLIHRIEIDEEAFEFSRAEEIYTIASILKLYLRQLPEPVFRWPLAERLSFTQDRETHIANDFIYLKQKFKRLPVIHVATLRAVIHHLRRVSMADNKMDVSNLSIIFSSILFGEEEVKDIRLLSTGKDSALEDLLFYAGSIFSFTSPTEERPPVRSQLLLSRSNTVASTRSPQGQRAQGALAPGSGVASATNGGGRSRAASASSNATDFNPQALQPPTVAPAPPGGGPNHLGHRPHNIGTQSPTPGSRSVHGVGHRRQLSWKSQQQEIAAEEAAGLRPEQQQTISPPPLPRRSGQTSVAALSPAPTPSPESSHRSGDSPRSASGPPSLPRPPPPPPLPARASSGLEALTKDADAVLSQLMQGVPPRSSSLPSSPASTHHATLQEQQQQQPLQPSPSHLHEATLPDDPDDTHAL